MKKVSSPSSGTVSKRRSQAGQALVFVTVGLVSFLAAAGLAIDIGYLRFERRRMQTAADAAALAAATDVNLGTAANENSDADAVSSSNGFTNGVNNTTVTVLNPPNNLPNTDPNEGNNDAVEVKVQQILPTFLMKVLGVNTSTIAAQAVATLGTSGNCIYALHAAGLTLNAGVNAPNCGIVSNGPFTGSGDVTATSVGVFGSSGGYTGVSSPAVQTTVQSAADPLAYLTPPTVPGTCMMTFTWSAGSTTIPEGCYSGIMITGGTVTFGNGLYILTGSTGLQISGTGGAIGPAVTIYNAGTGPITFSGTGTIGLEAPTAADVSGDASFGTLPPGILFYQDPANTAVADVSQGGSGNVTLIGVLYFPEANVTVGGSLSPLFNTVVVGSGVTVAAGSVLDADSTGTTVALPAPSPLRAVNLVE